MRKEFPKPVKREALHRAQGKCEAKGIWYGLEEGKVCGGSISGGFHFDHIVADSIGGNPTLDNCAVVCLVCHGKKTAQRDTPLAAKLKRISDKHNGIKKSGRPIPGSKASGLRKRMNGTVERRSW